LLTESANYGVTAWGSIYYYHLEDLEDTAELSSLLKVMVMLEDAPAYFIGKLSQQNTEICTEGRQFRAQLPSYLEQQRAVVVVHCPLPAVLQSLVAAYATTTPEDMWTDGLRVQAPRAKKARARETEEAEDKDSPRPHRFHRLHQKRL
jgi:hypothetical protein